MVSSVIPLCSAVPFRSTLVTWGNALKCSLGDRPPTPQVTTALVSSNSFLTANSFEHFLSPTVFCLHKSAGQLDLIWTLCVCYMEDMCSSFTPTSSGMTTKLINKINTTVHTCAWSLHYETTWCNWLLEHHTQSQALRLEYPYPKYNWSCKYMYTWMHFVQHTMPKAMVDTRQRTCSTMDACNIPTDFFEACSDNILYTRQTAFFVEANYCFWRISRGSWTD